MMATPGNRELYEMVQVLEERVTQLTGWRVMIEGEIEDILSTVNKINESNFRKEDWNQMIQVLARIKALNNVSLFRGMM